MVGYDRINELPDSLLEIILFNLTTKDSVRTSVLTKRWKNLWLNVPILDLDVSDFPRHGQVLNRFVDRYLEFNREPPRMHKFKVHTNQYSEDRIDEWVATAVDRGIQHLDVETDLNRNMPENMYKSNTLVSLKLVTVGIKISDFVVSLPCLKIMHLEDIWYDEDSLIVERLISGCPVLEDLTLIGPTVYVSETVLLAVRVRSQTLKILRLTFPNITTRTDFSVEIDAPRLEYLSFKENQSDTIVLKNLTSLFKIDIDTEFHAKYGSALDPKEIAKRITISDFLSAISTVRDMNISQSTIEVLYLYCNPIPQFENLYCLQAASSGYTLQLLPTFLESFPNLKELILDFDVSMEPEQTEFTYVPQCLLSSLESIDIRELSMGEETGKKLVRYFLEKSVVLKKLILRFRDYSTANHDSNTFKELRTFPKCSPKCQIIIH